MNLLVIDTSTATMAVAVCKDGSLSAGMESSAERNHAVHLPPAIAEVLKQSGLEAGDLAGVAAGRGPGSYTGVRIGVTVGKTMAWTLDVPLYGFSSLEALAWTAVLAVRSGEASAAGASQLRTTGHAPGDTWILPVMNARRGQAYAALLNVPSANDGTAGPTMQRLEQDGIRLLRDWLVSVADRAAGAADTLGTEAAAKPAAIIVAGEVSGFRELLDEAAGWEALNGIPLIALETAMTAEACSKAALHAVEHGEREDVHGFVPNYAQLTEAEVKLNAKNAAQAAEEGSRC
ncbi:tRNA (adenosine(37)-N6)-threonylcarbamoyltransferase complex dimerization subunit type 1 TsaB [Paenibacillus turpanensis]|uniref:tRNA (adenosine(37)-N6)-threonylcarbamoyltransferase complex dimerization subunit type 1 TsaB n=1 Tax=Paenibacillus turpanensis TaxID=2689078 RepID=UPI001409F927|nr:tRNA (adenosine(37)-N6)-threonylcarbamoyltransferase complex dimerization subunit type 1 TsaB [Paenibacillus turpanensis]